jgi:AcrR family transcriptional regulator
MLLDMSDVNRTIEPKPTSATRPNAWSGVRVRRPTREAVRRRLLDAAVEVFAECGFENASLDQVAAAAGLTKGAIYSNFARKDDLFFAMMTDQVLHRVEIIRTALAANTVDTHGQQTLRDIGRLLTEAFTAQREWQLVFLDFWRRAVRDDAVRAQFVAHRRVVRAAIAERVGQIYGGAPSPGDLTVEDVVTVLLALCNGLAIEHFVDPDLIGDDLFGRVLARLAREG